MLVCGPLSHVLVLYWTHPSLAGFLRRMLGRGEETRVGAPPTPPWACACTMVATGWVAPNVVLMGLATKPSAKTTPEWKKTRITKSPQLGEALINTVLFLLKQCTFSNYQVLLQTALVAAAE